MTEQQVLVVILKIFVFLLLAASAYWFLYEMHRFAPVKKLQEKVEELERQRLLEGDKDKAGIFEKYLDRLDGRLTQAGFKKLVPRASVEIYFLLNVLEFTLLFCFMGEGVLVPLMVAAMAVYLNRVLLDFCRYRNKKIIEGHLLEFVNMVSDYSLSESELTRVFYKCGQSLPNPLRDLLVQCHLGARSSGDTGQALSELRRGVDHFLFREIVLLLELCSRSGGDYQKVIGGCRDMVNRYLQEEKEKASVVRALIGEAAIMTAVAVYGIRTMLKEFAGGIVATGSMGEFFLQEPAGQVSLLVYTGLALAMVQVIIRFAKR